MGKTEAGAIWLDKKLLSPYDYWQFWRNTDDRDVVKFLKVFTDLEINQINNLQYKNINDLKILLANKATAMLHGNKAASISELAAKEAFSSGSLGSNLPTLKIKLKDFDKQIGIIDLIILCKLENSKSEIRRLLKGNAIKIDDQLIKDDKLIINNQLLNKNYLKLSIGKKRHIKIEII